MQKITSRDNQKLKFARKVRDGRTEEAIFVEGLRLVEEALRSNLKIVECFIAEQFDKSGRGENLISLITSRTYNISEVPEKIFNSIADTENPQGVILICEKPETANRINLNKNQEYPLVILLHEINNPNNLGAILRTAGAVDVSGVILTRKSADVFAPKALRASMGASFRLDFWTDADFDEAIKWARENNLTSVCADINAEKTLWEIDWNKPRLLIFGSEAHGLSFEERSLIDESLIIPMENDVESLNLAVSCAIVLYEAKRNWSL